MEFFTYFTYCTYILKIVSIVRTTTNEFLQELLVMYFMVLPLFTLNGMIEYTVSNNHTGVYYNKISSFNKNPTIEKMKILYIVRRWNFAQVFARHRVIFARAMIGPSSRAKNSYFHT